VEITADRQLPREVDGEVIFAGTSLAVALRPQALMVRARRF
jgi:hypothetical protein